MNVQKELEQKIRSFAAELAGLVRQSVVATVESAVGLNGKQRKSNGTSRAVPRAPREPKKGGRRTRRQLQQTAELIRKYIEEHPGQRMEQIGEAIQKPTRVLRRPLNWLLAKAMIVRQGEKRASRYYLPLPGKAPKAGKKAGKKAKKTAKARKSKTKKARTLRTRSKGKPKRKAPAKKSRVRMKPAKRSKPKPKARRVPKVKKPVNAAPPAPEQETPVT